MLKLLSLKIFLQKNFVFSLSFFLSFFEEENFSRVWRKYWWSWGLRIVECVFSTQHQHFCLGMYISVCFYPRLSTPQEGCDRMPTLKLYTVSLNSVCSFSTTGFHIKNKNRNLPFDLPNICQKRLVWFGVFWFYGLSTIVGYLTPNPLYTYVLKIYDFVRFGFMLYQPLYDKSSLYIYIKYIWFGLGRFCCISTIVDYLMINPCCGADKHVDSTNCFS